MNEIELANEMEELPNAEECDSATEPLAQADDEAVEANGIPDEQTQESTCDSVEDSELPSDSLSDSDPVVEEGPSDAEQIAFLRAELSRMQAALEEKDAFYSRVSQECSEFSALFPDTPLSDLSDRVWEAVKNGVPIAAAYALEQHRNAMAQARANQVLQRNRERSAGAIGQPDEEYFSPAEVRAMSQAEVRRNYQKIMLSMQKWK